MRQPITEAPHDVRTQLYRHVHGGEGLGPNYPAAIKLLGDKYSIEKHAYPPGFWLAFMNSQARDLSEDPAFVALLAAGRFADACASIGTEPPNWVTRDNVPREFVAYVRGQVVRADWSEQIYRGFWPAEQTAPVVVPPHVTESAKASYQFRHHVLFDDVSSAINVLRRFNVSLKRAYDPEVFDQCAAQYRNAHAHVGFHRDGEVLWFSKGA